MPAQILLKADESDGSKNYSDPEIAEIFFTLQESTHISIGVLRSWKTL